MEGKQLVSTIRECIFPQHVEGKRVQQLPLAQRDDQNWRMAFNFPRGLDSEAQDYTVFQRTAEQPQDDQHSYEDIKTRPECLSMTEWVLLLWSSLGSSLLFLEALGSSLFLPIIPALVRELGPEKSSASATAWVGLLVGAYYAGRSSVLAAASFKHGRRSSLADDLEVEDSVSLQEQMVRLQSPPRLLRACVALAFSVTMYVASGLTTVGRQHEAVKSIEGQLWRLAAFRLVGGALSAAHRILGRGCLNECTISSNSSHQTGLRTEVVASGEAHKLMHVASGGRLCGLVVGCAVAGALFSPGSARPIHLLGIAGAVAHLPSWVLLVLIWRSGRGGGGGRGQGGWSAISNSNGYDTVRGTPGGSDAEVELIERSAWSGGGADVSGSGKHGAMSGVPVESAGSGSEPGGVGDELAVPGRYLRGCKGDLEEAERRWRLTLEWRSRERIDEVRVFCLRRRNGEVVHVFSSMTKAARDGSSEYFAAPLGIFRRTSESCKVNTLSVSYNAIDHFRLLLVPLCTTKRFWVTCMCFRDAICDSCGQCDAPGAKVARHYHFSLRNNTIGIYSDIHADRLSRSTV